MALRTQTSPLARVDSLVSERLVPRHDTGFMIEHSASGGQRQALVSSDAATCDACLSELFDLACDARSAGAVATLRRRKHRWELVHVFFEHEGL